MVRVAVWTLHEQPNFVGNRGGSEVAHHEVDRFIERATVLDGGSGGVLLLSEGDQHGLGSGA